MTRRIVRVSRDFLDSLDAQLPAVRGPGPSANDFAAFDLLEIVEVFATGWESLPRWNADRDSYRVWVSVGRLVAFYSVVGQLAPDGAVELVEIDIDVEGLPDPEAD